MIDKVVIKNWKRFEHVEFDVRGRHRVLVGPNNGGKASVLQAISAWWFALHRWRSANPDLDQRNGWQKLPITIDQFNPVQRAHVRHAVPGSQLPAPCRGHAG